MTNNCIIALKHTGSSRAATLMPIVEIAKILESQFKKQVFIIIKQQKFYNSLKKEYSNIKTLEELTEQNPNHKILVCNLSIFANIENKNNIINTPPISKINNGKWFAEIIKKIYDINKEHIFITHGSTDSNHHIEKFSKLLYATSEKHHPIYTLENLKDFMPNNQISIYPLFLIAGKHLNNDIPNILKEKDFQYQPTQPLLDIKLFVESLTNYFCEFISENQK